MLMFATFGRVDFAGVLAGVPGTDDRASSPRSACSCCSAPAASRRSSRCSRWLGDAMAGPTPVSALIHAATMVTAGVYLVVRSHVIFDAAPTAQLVVAIVGAITLVFGAVVGCAKDDIKKALAASTMSQIGYMMLAAGLGPVGYAFAIFHLLTHGFFKAGHVPRRRLGHARHERPGRHAPLRRPVGRHEDHLGRPSASAGWRSSASRRSPASGARTRSSRPRSSARAGGRGCSVGPRCSAPASPPSTCRGCSS